MSEYNKNAAEHVESALLTITPALQKLDWSHGFTRDDLQTQITDFPHILYLRLPASKHFLAAHEVEQAILHAISRGEGEFMPDVTSAEEREVRAAGGPPMWGNDPLLSGLSQESSSATDTEGLDVSQDELSQYDSNK